MLLVTLFSNKYQEEDLARKKIFSFEPVFAAVTAFVLNEKYRLVVGCMLIFFRFDNSGFLAEGIKKKIKMSDNSARAKFCKGLVRLVQILYYKACRQTWIERICSKSLYRRSFYSG
jgi:hypothetical protein